MPFTKRFTKKSRKVGGKKSRRRLRKISRKVGGKNSRRRLRKISRRVTRRQLRKNVRAKRGGATSREEQARERERERAAEETAAEAARERERERAAEEAAVARAADELLAKLGLKAEAFAAEERIGEEDYFTFQDLESLLNLYQEALLEAWVEVKADTEAAVPTVAADRERAMRKIPLGNNLNRILRKVVLPNIDLLQKIPRGSQTNATLKTLGPVLEFKYPLRGLSGYAIKSIRKLRGNVSVFKAALTKLGRPNLFDDLVLFEQNLHGLIHLYELKDKFTYDKALKQYKDTAPEYAVFFDVDETLLSTAAAKREARGELAEDPDVQPEDGNGVRKELNKVVSLLKKYEKNVQLFIYSNMMPGYLNFLLRGSKAAFEAYGFESPVRQAPLAPEYEAFKEKYGKNYALNYILDHSIQITSTPPQPGKQSHLNFKDPSGNDGEVVLVSFDGLADERGVVNGFNKDDDTHNITSKSKQFAGKVHIVPRRESDPIWNKGEERTTFQKVNYKSKSKMLTWLNLLYGDKIPEKIIFFDDLIVHDYFDGKETKKSRRAENNPFPNTQYEFVPVHSVFKEAQDAVDHKTISNALTKFFEEEYYLHLSPPPRKSSLEMLLESPEVARARAVTAAEAAEASVAGITGRRTAP